MSPASLRRSKRHLGASGPIARMGLLTGLIGFLSASAACAQDRVRVQYPEKPGVVVLIGEVEDFLGESLTIRLKTSGAEIVRSDQILEVETYHTPSHREGLDLLDKGETDQALSRLEAALKEENRKWVRRRIYAALVRGYSRKGDLLSAARSFEVILVEDPSTTHWAVAPLVWSPTPVGGPLRNQARAWLTDPQPGLRLLGASFLLLDPTEGEQARRELADLARSPQRPIAPLARAQVWRTRLAESAIRENELQSWRAEIEYLPRSLRAGPQYLLARGYLTRSAPRDAAAEFLWLPAVYSDLEVLSSRSLWEAAAALREVQGDREASTILRSLVEQYPWSVEAVEARALLAAEKPEGSSDADAR